MVGIDIKNSKVRSFNKSKIQMDMPFQRPITPALMKNSSIILSNI